MKFIQFPNLIMKYLRIVLALGIVLTNFGSRGVRIVFAAAPPPNNFFENATPVPGLPYAPGALDTTGASKENGEPELTGAVGGCEGIPLWAGLATVWYTFTAGANTPVFLSTAGSTTSEPDPGNPGHNHEYDTYIAVFTSSVTPATLNSLTLLACNDNPSDSTNQARLAFNAVLGTTYYIEVAEYTGQYGIPIIDPGYNGGSLNFTMTTGLSLTGNTGGLGGVKLTYPGGATTSSGNGDYSLAIPTTFTDTVTPSKTGYLFSPPVRVYTNVTTNKTAQNFNLHTVSPADFNGDGMTDVAVFRPSNHTWYISGQGTSSYGQKGDIPVPADYNGDGKDDIAVYRPSNSTWYIQGQGSFPWGVLGDIPVVADYNGDGMADIAVFRPSNSTWYIRNQGQFAYGTDGDIPVVADYSGDGKADIAVFRPTNSTWYLYGIGPRMYGTVGDIPVVADYTGDGKADIAVFRPTNSTWYIYGVGPSMYGTVGDIPAIGDYNGDNKADITVFRPTNSTWYKYGVGPSVYGTVGDIPV